MYYVTSDHCQNTRPINNPGLPAPPGSPDATSGAPEDASPQELVDRLVAAMSVRTTNVQLERLLLDLLDEMEEEGVL